MSLIQLQPGIVLVETEYLRSVRRQLAEREAADLVCWHSPARQLWGLGLWTNRMRGHIWNIVTLDEPVGTQDSTDTVLANVNVGWRMKALKEHAQRLWEQEHKLHQEQLAERDEDNAVNAAWLKRFDKVGRLGRGDAAHTRALLGAPS